MHPPLRSISALPVSAALLFSAVAAQTPDPPLPSPSELVELILAGRDRLLALDSFEMEYETETRKGVAPFTNPPYMTARITSRRTPDRSYMRESRVIEGKRQVQETAFGDWTGQRLGSFSDGHFEASIDWSFRLRRLLDVTVSDEMYTPCGDFWDRISDSTGSVRRHRKTGHLILSAGIDGGNILTVVVDPSRGFVPVETENRRADGSVYSACELTGWREVAAGMFLPFKWKKTTAMGSYQITTNVRSARINADLPPGLLSISFPPGVYVRNRALPGFWNVFNLGLIAALIVFLFWYRLRRAARSRC